MANKNFKITDVEIDKKAKSNIPEKGYYVEMEWMFGDADGYKNTVAGPFPEDHKDLLVEFLNILQEMLNLYRDGKGGWDGYDEVEGYEMYFDEDFWYEEKYPNCSDEDLALQEIREYVGAEIPSDNCDMGTVPSIEKVKVYYHDGVSPEKYNVKIDTDIGEKLKKLD